MLIKPLIKNDLQFPLIREFYEEWKPINLYPIAPNMYIVSNTGKVVNTVTGNICRANDNGHGYLYVSLRNINGAYKKYYIHRLVAISFIPNYYNLETVNHLAEKDFNMSYNLEWMSRSNNVYDARYTGKNTSNTDRNLFTDEKIHQACKMLEEEKDYGDILKEINVPDNKDTRDMLCKIKSGAAWKNISKLYNIENKNRKYTVEDETVHRICQLISEGLKDADIIRTVYGDHLDTYEKRKSYGKYVWKIRHKQRRTDISDLYF